MRSKQTELFGQIVEVKELPLSWLADNLEFNSGDLKSIGSAVAVCVFASGQRLFASGQDLLDSLGASEIDELKKAMLLIIELSGLSPDQKKTV